MTSIGQIIQRIMARYSDATDPSDAGNPSNCLSPEPAWGRLCITQGCEREASTLDLGQAWYNSPWCHVCAGEGPAKGYTPREAPPREVVEVTDKGVTVEEWQDARGRELYPPLARLFDADCPYSWCYVVGAVGCGKSTQGMLTLAKALDAGITQCLYVPESELIASLRPSSNNKRDMSYYEQLDLLVIDEAFSDVTSDWAGDQLRFLLHARHRRKAKTILLTNHSLEYVGAQSRLGMQVQRRILESCGLTRDPSALMRGDTGYMELVYSWSYRAGIGSGLELPQGALNVGVAQWPKKKL